MIWNNFFLRFGDLKNESHFLKKPTFSTKHLKDCMIFIHIVLKIFFYFIFYFRQIEEAEEIAAINLAKFRKAQVDMQESLERADISEQALAKSRVRGRSMSLARDL